MKTILAYKDKNFTIKKVGYKDKKHNILNIMYHLGVFIKKNRKELNILRNAPADKI